MAERIRDFLPLVKLGDGWQPTSATSYWGNASANGINSVVTTDALDFTFVKSATADVPSVSTFTLQLGGGQFAARSGAVIVAETKGRLSIHVSATSTASVRAVVSYSGAATVSIYTSESITVMFPVTALVCPTKLNVSAWQGDAAALKNGFMPMTFSLKPASLLISVSTIQITNQLTSGLSVVSANPLSGMVVARIAMLTAFVDCAVDKIEDDGNSLTGFHFGDARGQYQRGAVVGNLLSLYGACLGVLLVIAIPIGIATAVRRGDVAASVTRAWDVAHVPSVFVVPFAVVYQPTLASALRLMLWRPVPGDALLGFVGVALLAVFAVPFVWVLAHRFPCVAVPRDHADMDKMRRKVSKFWVLRLAEKLCGPAALGLVIRLFDARVHWKPRSPAFQRWKRRFLMLFDDWMCVWYPILDILASASLAVLTSVISGGDVTRCRVVVGLTTVVYVILFVAALLRPCMNWMGNVYLVLVNALSLACSVCLLYNQLSPNSDAVQLSVLCLFAVSAVTSAKMIPDLAVKLVSLRYAIVPALLASIRARAATVAVQPEPTAPRVGEAQPLGGQSVDTLPPRDDVTISIEADVVDDADVEDSTTQAHDDSATTSDIPLNPPVETDLDELRALEDEIAAAFFPLPSSTSAVGTDAGHPMLLLLDDSAPARKRNDLVEAYSAVDAEMFGYDLVDRDETRGGGITNSTAVLLLVGVCF